MNRQQRQALAQFVGRSRGGPVLQGSPLFGGHPDPRMESGPSGVHRWLELLPGVHRHQLHAVGV